MTWPPVVRFGTRRVMGSCLNVRRSRCRCGFANQRRARSTAMTITDRIEMDPKIMMGKPVIRGTRIPVELLLRKLGEGATEEDLLDAYPRLKREDIRAALAYAADAIAHEETILVAEPSAPTR